MGMLVKTDGTTTPVKPKDGAKFSLEELQGFVGGYIEMVTVRIQGFPLAAFINEEGKLKGLPLNHAATVLYGNPHDVIVGDMIVCDPGEVD